MKDAKGHGSDAGVHSAQINALPAKMTKAHFQVIAERLRSAQPGANATPEEHAAHAALVGQYADKLATTNPGFNRQRFMEAIGGKVTKTSRASSLSNAAAKIDRMSSRGAYKTPDEWKGKVGQPQPFPKGKKR